MRRQPDLTAILVLSLALGAAAAPGTITPKPDAPVVPTFKPGERAVSTWRTEAAAHLVLTPDQVAAFRGAGVAPRVARCVKLNNYWCIKRAGWNGEIAADNEGHVAFASAPEGAAVAALLLKRYYIDFERKTAMAIISHWAPAQCGGSPGLSAKTLAPRGLGKTLRARWLAGHSRGFVTPLAGRKAPVRRSVIADHRSRMIAAPTIAAGLGETSRGRPMTLDALLMSSPNAPPSRSMLGMPRSGRGRAKVAASGFGSVSSCGFDSDRIASYAAKAAAGITPGPGGDLGLFTADGTPTQNLRTMMTNMSRVEIGPFAASPALIEDGIARAFQPGRNPGKS